MKLKKKAQIGEWFDITLSGLCIFIFFTLIIIYAPSPAKLEAKQIQNEFSLAESESLLLQYSRLNADLISESYTNNDFNKLKTNTEDFFNKYETECYSLSIYLANKEVTYFADSCYFFSQIRKKVANITLPVENKPLEKLNIIMFRGIV